MFIITGRLYLYDGEIPPTCEEVDNGQVIAAGLPGMEIEIGDDATHIESDIIGLRDGRMKYYRFKEGEKVHCQGRTEGWDEIQAGEVRGFTLDLWSA